MLATVIQLKHFLKYRLKDWVSKQADREKEREDRKQKKLEKLRQEYHHEFHDPEYFRVRSEVLDNVNEALEQGNNKTYCNFVLYDKLYYLSHSGIQASSSTAVEPPQKKLKSSDDGPTLKKTAFWYVSYFTYHIPTSNKHY